MLNNAVKLIILYKDKVIGFSKGEGGGINLPIVQWGGGGGCTEGKYFQRVLVMHKRVTKKKHNNLPQQFICEG